MDLSDFQLIRLSKDYPIKDFDCDDSDLNEFLVEDSSIQMGLLFSVTYLLEKNDKTIAFFTLVNDKIKLEDGKNKQRWKKKIGRKIPHNKQRRDYPAVKLGRLGVTNDFKGNGIGTIILNYLKIWFVFNNKTGCRFLTVDAYSRSLGFYEKNGFEFLTDSDIGDTTRLMYFDLITIA